MKESKIIPVVIDSPSTGVGVVALNLAALCERIEVLTAMLENQLTGVRNELSRR